MLQYTRHVIYLAQIYTITCTHSI